MPAGDGRASAGGATSSSAPAGAGDLDAVRRMWTEVLGALATIKRTTWSLVSQYAQVLDYDGRRLLLGFDSPGRAQSFARGAHPDFLRQALIDVIGLECMVEAIDSAQFRSGVSDSGRPEAQRSAPTQPGPSAPTVQPARAALAAQPADLAGPDRASGQDSPKGSPGPNPKVSDSGPLTPAEPAERVARAAGGSPSTRSSAAHWTSPEASAPGPVPATDGPPVKSSGPAARSTSARSTSARSGGPSRRPPSTSPYDDVPPPVDEPPDEEHLPPDDGRPAPQGWPVPAVVNRTESASAPAPMAPPASARVVDLADDLPSSDDIDFEGSHMVGAQVVQQLLGGRVIEETEQ